MQRLFALIELLDEFLNAVLVIKCFRFRCRLALVSKNNFQTRIQKRQFPQALRDDVRLEFHRLAENFLVRQKRDERAGLFRFADDFKLLHRLAALEFHVIHLLVARDFYLEPFAHRVHALRADAVRAAGKFVAALTIFAAGVQRRQHEFHAGQTGILVDVHRNAATVVADGNRTIHMNRHLDAMAMPREMLVHGIVQHFAHAMMQRAFVSAADIHTGFFADGFETFQ